MAIDYTRLRDDVAQRLIRENGKLAYILVPWNDVNEYVEEGYWDEGYVEPGFDPWNPPADYRYEYPVYLLETRYKIDDRRETLVQQGDKLGLVSPEVLTQPGPMPTKNRDIRIDGIVYQMLDLQPINPGGVVVLFKIHARK